MSNTRVSRLLGLLSPVTMTRTIISSVWNRVESILHRLLGLPTTICIACLKLALLPLARILEYTLDYRPNIQFDYLPTRDPGSPLAWQLDTPPMQPDSPIQPESQPAMQQAPDLPTLLTGVPNPTCEQVSQAVKCIHNNAVNIIVSQISQKNRLQEYRNELQKWKEENEKETMDLYNLDEKDRITMKALALSVKKLKALKAKKNKFAKLNNEKMLKELNKNTLTTEDLKIIKETNKKLYEIESEMNRNKKECLDIVKTSEKLSQLLTKVLLHSDFFNDFSLDSDVPLNSVINKFRAVTYKSQMENDAFQSTLVATNEKLDKILSATERISTALDDFREETPDIPSMKNELAALRSQLEQEQLVLRNVKRERDDLKVKLDILEDLIEDQVDFLDSRGNNLGLERALVQ